MTNDIGTDLQLIFTDLKMLQYGTWEPDYHSTGASIETIERITKKLIEAGVLNMKFTLSYNVES